MKPLSFSRHFALAAVLCAAAVPGARAGESICIRSYDIDHTEIPNDSTIMFHMRNRTVYKNTLPQRCPGLATATNGFTYEPTDPGTDEICSNLMTFRLNEFTGTGAGAGDGPVCMLGTFTKVAGP